MADFVYNEAKRAIAEGEIDFGSGGSDLRVLLVMTNTTADTEDDKNTFAGFTTLDEFDGANYTTGGLALQSEAVNEDAANNRAEFDAADITFSGIGAGTRNIQAAILYKWTTNVNSSMPIAYIDSGGFPIAANGGDLTMQWNAEGILNFT
jgi:hypothetical protein